MISKNKLTKERDEKFENVVNSKNRSKETTISEKFEIDDSI